MSVHDSFLRDMQNWVWVRFPTRQLSATDIFYALQWADSGVPARYFIDGFEENLRRSGAEFAKTGKLSCLRLEADRLIAAWRRDHAGQEKAAILVEDPYEKALSRLTMIGCRTENSLLRDELRIFYQNMMYSRTQARKSYPDWNQRSESFYPLKARAIVDWEDSLARLFEHCYVMLSEQEQSRLSSLSPQEQMHCMYISEDAQKTYKMRILNHKLADYYKMNELLEDL
ncbi:MAG: hypothetical protein IJU23_08210 [Proteobacteria bacterium]|nr:hypothetical protein [Pseudomonadota bacterium]